jgi:hypothetical protein
MSRECFGTRAFDENSVSCGVCPDKVACMERNYYPDRQFNYRAYAPDRTRSSETALARPASQQFQPFSLPVPRAQMHKEGETGLVRLGKNCVLSMTEMALFQTILYIRSIEW